MSLESSKTSVVRPDVRAYTDAVAFLNDYLRWSKSSRHGFSARLWSERMGFKNHSLLSLLLAGKRELQSSHVDKICRAVDFSDAEKKYFTHLVLFKNAGTDDERDLHEQVLKELAHQEQMTFRDVEAFRMLGSWLHLALLEICGLEDFKDDPTWIAKRLEKHTTATEIRDALVRLENLGLLERRGGRLRKTNRSITFGGKQASRSVRQYHKQVLQLAESAVDNQKFNERLLHAFTINMDPADMPKLEDLVSEFRKKCERTFAGSRKKVTYQCNLQFFRLTKTGDSNEN